MILIAMTTAMVIIYYAGENENDDTNDNGGDDANDIDDDDDIDADNDDDG